MMTDARFGADELLRTLGDHTPSDTDDATLARLRGRLADEAARDGLLDVAYRTLDTPVGTLLLAATGRGLVRV
ncbi:MAG: hypothetical protein ACRDNS_33705, partial [Trebonia sp.]